MDKQGDWGRLRPAQRSWWSWSSTSVYRRPSGPRVQADSCGWHRAPPFLWPRGIGSELSSRRRIHQRTCIQTLRPHNRIHTNFVHPVASLASAAHPLFQRSKQHPLTPSSSTEALAMWMIPSASFTAVLYRLVKTSPRAQGSHQLTCSSRICRHICKVAWAPASGAERCSTQETRCRCHSQLDSSTQAAVHYTSRSRCISTIIVSFCA